MATFPSYKPVYPARKTVEPMVRDVSFQRGGIDGFEERAPFGINRNAPTWDLTFIPKSVAGTNEIYNFLLARQLDRESFTWTAPDETSAAQWKCEQFSKEMFDYNVARITAKFVKCFDPV